MHVYMKTTLDKYELPVAIADTAKELAEMVNTTPGCIYSTISHKYRGYYKVEIEDDPPTEMWADNDGRLWYYGANSEVIYVD